MAVVLTHNAPQALQRCLAAIDDQTLSPYALLVVDNASEPAATTGGSHSVADVAVLRLDENTGPAGGHARGFEAFLLSDCDYAWVMDDDCVPAPECLEILVDEIRENELALLYPRFVDEDTGRILVHHSWSGFLVARHVIETVGLPNEDFFWWKEDTEYLQWRIPQAGFAWARSTKARVSHRSARSGGHKAPWRIYYEVRNSIYYLAFVKRDVRRRRGRRFFVLARTLVRTLARIIFKEPDKAAKLRMYALGFADGVRRRLGKRIDVTAPEISRRS